MKDDLPFKEIWAVDFEFHPDTTPGGIQVPVCMVARELRSARLIRCWRDELLTMRRPPFDVSSDSLYVAYLASAELHCHLSLGWALPANVLDCFAEFRTLTNGNRPLRGNGLIGALAYFGLESIDAESKSHWRELILSGGPWSHDDRRNILDYCQTDVDALQELLPRLTDALSKRPHWLPHALTRGRYMRAVAAMEHRGIPIDAVTHERLSAVWHKIKAQLIQKVTADFDVFDGSTFKIARFEKLLAKHGVPWPRTPSGQIALDEDTFKQQVRAHPWLSPIREVRDSLGKLRLAELQIGPDARNRAMLGVFRSITGRNQPSNAKFIFGLSSWARSLIKPSHGMGLAYIDFSSQEMAIAARLSGDRGMMDGYTSGDMYLDFAVRAGLAPKGANKASHGNVRNMCKAVVLGTQYGMRSKTLAHRIGVPEFRAVQLLRAHREAYPRYWSWIDDVTNFASLHGYLDTTYGWRFHVTADTRPTTIQNFLCQANGAEMLRLACLFAHEEGLAICAPVHDAILLEAPLDLLDEHVAKLREIMTEAGRYVLPEFSVRTDAEIIRFPSHYKDERGQDMWDTVMALLATTE